MAIEIVSFPIKNGGSFQFATLNYQRVHQASPRPDGSSRGFAFIRFAAVESVDRAIEVGRCSHLR